MIEKTGVPGGGNGDGLPTQIIVDNGKYVRNETFELYQKAQIQTCQAYREHQKDLINAVRDELKGAIYLTATILGLIITVSSIIMLVLGR